VSFLKNGMERNIAPNKWQELVGQREICFQPYILAMRYSMGALVSVK
jgi:hypothetical protein